MMTKMTHTRRPRARAATAPRAATAMPLLLSAAMLPVFAASAHAQAASAPETSIVVTGRSAATDTPGGGLLSAETAPRAVQTISRDFIAKQAPTVNAQQLLAMLPSANVSDADPYGLMPGQSYVRGLDSSQLAWVMEGAPLNDIASGTFYAEEYVEAEDLKSVQLQPGSVNIATPTVNATAGQVIMTLQDPTHKFGGLVDFSVGSDNMTREYIRVNTGDIGKTGIRGYVSYSHTYADNWTGVGHAEKHHVNAKFVKDDWANGSKTALVVAYNNEVANFYRNPTLAQFNQFGNSFNYAAAPGTSSYYKQQVNPFANFSASAPTHVVLGDKLTLDDTPYIWEGVGSGAFGTTVTQGSTFAGTQAVNANFGVANGTSVNAESIGQNNQLRLGNTVSLDYKVLPGNTITAGWWYQHAVQHFYTRIGQVDANGNPVDYWGNKGVYTYNGGTPYDWRNYKNHAEVNVLFAQDAIDALGGKLHAEAGIKYAIIYSHLTSFVAGANPDQTLTTRKWLPQFGATYKLDDTSQFYATINTNFRTPQATSLVNFYSNTTGAQTQTSGSTKPETSLSEEIGYRYNGSVITASVSGFHYYFKNRQISLNTLINGTLLAESMNAGSQESWGVDAQIGTRPIIYHLRPYATFEYLDAKIKSNLPVTSTLGGATISDYLATNGRTQVASPHVQAGFGLDYDDKTLFVNIQAKYISKQYSSFMNDESLPAYVTTHASIGYRLPAFRMFKAPQIQLNVQNLFNGIARTGVYSLKTNATTQTGLNGGVIAASAPAYYLMPSRTVALTLSTAF
jgi:iron complex outermembrane receptor protein